MAKKRKPGTLKDWRMLGARLRTLRERRKLSILQAARGLHVNPFLLRAWEAETLKQSWEEAGEAREFYHTTLDYLTGRSAYSWRP